MIDIEFSEDDDVVSSEVTELGVDPSGGDTVEAGDREFLDGNPRLSDLLARGFTVRREGSVQAEPSLCPYCSGPVHGVISEWYCEVPSPRLVSRETFAGCACSWCRINLSGKQVHGRPRVHCGSVPCKRAHNRKLQRESRERRKGLLDAA